MLPLALFAMRSSTSQATGVSPFRMLFGVEPRSPSEASLQAWSQPLSPDGFVGDTYASELCHELQAVWSLAGAADHRYRTAGRQAPDVCEDSVSKHRTSPARHLLPGQSAVLTGPQAGGGGKLQAEAAESVVVRDRIGNSRYRVMSRRKGLVDVHARYLRESHPADSVVDPVESLRPALPAKRQRMSGVDRGCIYQVERILVERLGPDLKPRFLVKWSGYDASQNTWEPESSFSTYTPGAVNSVLRDGRASHPPCPRSNSDRSPSMARDMCSTPVENMS